MKFFPDWRRCLNELQRYSSSGQIDSGILVNLSEKNMKDLIVFMKEKDFTSVRKWVVNNLDNDPARIFRKIYDNLYQYFDAKFYSNNEFDNLSEVQINQNFTCSVSTLEGISGKCNPPEEMINIIKEKLLPTEAGNDIKQFLQSIGITV